MSKAKFNDARQALEKAVADDDGELTSKARFMIGETYFHQKSYEAAKKEYLKVALLGKHDEWKAAALLQVGKCHEQLGDRAAAAEDYRRVVEAHGTTPAAKQAKERLEEIAAGARKSDGNRVKE
jgi:TolA-binding protein